MRKWIGSRQGSSTPRISLTSVIYASPLRRRLFEYQWFRIARAPQRKIPRSGLWELEVAVDNTPGAGRRAANHSCEGSGAEGHGSVFSLALRHFIDQDHHLSGIVRLLGRENLWPSNQEVGAA